MTSSESIPVLIIVAFVIYPFAMFAFTVMVMSWSKRSRFPAPLATIFAVVAAAFVMWAMARYGSGKYAHVTGLAAILFVCGAASTGAFLGAVLEVVVPLGTGNARVTGPADDNSCRSPGFRTSQDRDRRGEADRPPELKPAHNNEVPRSEE